MCCCSPAERYYCSAWRCRHGQARNYLAFWFVVPQSHVPTDTYSAPYTVQNTKPLCNARFHHYSISCVDGRGDCYRCCSVKNAPYVKATIHPLGGTTAGVMRERLLTLFALGCGGAAAAAVAVAGGSTAGRKPRRKLSPERRKPFPNSAAADRC